MEFEYTTTIYITSQDLRKMYLYVKNGGDFSDIFNSVMSLYDDDDYYNRGYIYDQVQEEILRRVRQSEKEEQTNCQTILNCLTFTRAQFYEKNLSKSVDIPLHLC